MLSPPARTVAFRALGALTLAGALAPHLPAQSPGATVPVTHTITFETHGQSMWGPADAPANIDITFPLFREGWSDGGTDSDIRNALGTQWGGSIGGTTAGDVGLSFRIYDIGTGAVDVTYPVRVVLDVPEPNSFRDGAEITIGSRLEVLPGWSLATTPPGGTLSLGGLFGASSSARGKICFFGCSDEFDLLPRVNIPTDPFELFRIESQGKLVFDEVDPPGPVAKPLTLQSLPYAFGCLLDCDGFPDIALIGDFLGFAGPVDAPRVETTDALGGGAITAAGQHRFVDLTVDLDQYLTLVGVPPLGFQSNPALQLVTGASFGYDIADLALGLGISQRQSFEFLPTVMVTVVFPQAVPYTVLRRDGTPKSEAYGASATFEAGESVRLVFPGGLTTPQPGTPTYSLANTFRSRTDFLFDESLVVSAGRFALSTPSKSVTETEVSTVCSFTWIAVGVCEFFGGILRTITSAVTEVAPAVSIGLGPLASETLVDEEQSAPLFPASGGSAEWELQGFQPFTEAPFLLDPEDPRIVVATTLGSATLAGGPAGAILQTVTVHNEGDVALSMLQLRDAVSATLGAGAFQVVGVSSPTLATDAAFDGATNPSLLAGADVLEPGATATVAVLLAAAPGSIYAAALRGDGTSPIGTPVNASASATLGIVAFEIIPEQISAWSQGVLPVRILGAGIDASRIDPATVTLEGIAPSQWALASSGSLNLKFALPEVLAALERRLDGASALVTLVRGEGGDPALMVDAADVAAAVMGDAARLTPVTLAAVDRIGNADGRLDLGDLRAVVMAGRAGAASAPGGPSLAVSSEQRVLVVTGALTDGTPFFGEDDLSVMYGGQ